MSAGTDFLASLQKKTVKSTVQQKQQKRANASAVDVSALLEAALRQKKPTEAVADVRQSADVATASFYHRLTRIKASLLNKSRKARQIKQYYRSNQPQNPKTSLMPVSQPLSRKLWMPKGYGAAGYCRKAAK